MPAARCSRLAATAVVVAVLSLAGCGEDGAESAETSSPSPPPSKSGATPTGSPSEVAGPLSEQQARAALLAEGNLPAGWRHADLADAAPAGAAPEELRTDDRDCRRLFDVLRGDADEHEARTAASRGYRGGADGPYLSSRVASYDSEDGDGSKRALSTFRSVRANCRTFTVENGAVTVAFTVSRLKAGPGGDSACARLRGTARGGPADGEQLTLDLVLSRVRQSTTSVALLSVGDGDTGLARSAAEAAAERLTEVTAGRTPSPTVPPEQGD
ncbi:hypothetical protein [Streptomyces qinglanensis]|uniref:hypothetical protein n=1 Tax=Streptomyces qinglanensis TaxID=943816 RepID=UPI00379C97DA